MLVVGRICIRRVRGLGGGEEEKEAGRGVGAGLKLKNRDRLKVVPFSCWPDLCLVGLILEV